MLAHRAAQDRVERLGIFLERRHVVTIPYSLNEPRPNNCSLPAVSFDIRERARQIKLQIARCPIITQTNLLMAQLAAVVQRALDLAFELVASARQPARHRGLMLVHHSANLLER